MRQPIRTIIAILLGAALFTSAQAPAFAQTDATEEAKNEARALADKGYEHFEAGEYQKAIQLFHEADTKFHAPTLVLMQGHAQRKSGNLIEARALYQRVANETLPPDATKEFRDAQAEANAALSELTGKTGYLKIILTGGTADKVQISVDGLPVPPSKIGQPIEMNPGKRRIEAIIDAEEGGRSVFKQVVIKPGRTKQIQLAFKKSGIVVEGQKADEDDEDELPDPKEPGSIVPAAIAFGFGAAGIGVGAVTGFLWLDKKGKIEDTCGAGAGDCPAAQADIDARKTFGTVAIIGLAAGGVGLGVGTILALTRDTGEPEEQTAGVSLVVGPASIGLRGRF
ncbi:MAG: hypothetical protein L6Q76_31855 [Polyangiaceae bacterium]|nr:hypothetical protein [Polyangiaceae bacterium]